MNFNQLDIAFVVLHTSPLDEPGTKDAGGMNVVVLAQAMQLAKLGHRVRLITRRSDTEQAAVVEIAPGLTAHLLDAGPARLITKGEHEALIAPFGEALHQHLVDHPADLLHAEHWYSGLAALPAARALGIPLVQSYHSIAAATDTPLGDGERPEAPGRLAGEQRLAHEADLIITVSEAEKQTVLERLGGATERVRVVLPGVDTEVFRPCGGPECEERAAWLAHGGRPEVLVAGRLDPLKRFDLAIAAVAEIAAERRPNLRIVGAAPPDGAAYARELHDAIADAGMITTTAFDGALLRSALAERIRLAALVLVPSHSETYGLVALEAAASGVPVIAAATGGLREAVIDGETGVLLESDEPEVWASEIERLLADTELAAQMGKAAREHALRHSWQASTERLLEVYRELLAE
ncbi:glycosyltransferase [Leucobacter sp. UT-8R-CII-1-4]|uniref:glycosyltransferase n=1 Tax=Leucobacter sp. UT-8R-CII-1-4 TaxID=3040075 RepID=UPI0024A994F3|nr:glycosyltransferase [Leucobacter sp. UT-8R-CII-1-4]MDI6023525.1 glycosyltransferase [Leucobacter sp. UT-8R-CII-1-4]